MEEIKMNVMIKKLIESLDNLEKKNQIKFICYVLDSWDNKLINSSNIGSIMYNNNLVLNSMFKD